MFLDMCDFVFGCRGSCVLWHWFLGRRTTLTNGSRVGGILRFRGVNMFVLLQLFFEYNLAWIYLMCACRNPICGWLRRTLIWWSILLRCIWGGRHCIFQNTSRRSHPLRERNHLRGIYVSRGYGYDSLCNIHVDRVCIACICLLILLLAGGRKRTSGFRDRHIHCWHGHGDCIVVGHEKGNPLISFSYNHTCPLERKGKIFWYICTYTFFRLCWKRCSTGFLTSLNWRYV